jgi:DNA-binding beta-propeller fold protein YncE
MSGPVYSVGAGSDGTTFYVLNGTAKARVVTVVNGQKDATIASVPAPSDAVAVVPSPGEHNLYVLEADGTVSEISVANGQLVTQFSVGQSGRALALSPDGTILYVLKGRGAARNVAVVNLATEAVTKVLPAAADTQGIVLSPTGTTLYDIVGTGSYGNIQSYHV